MPRKKTSAAQKKERTCGYRDESGQRCGQPTRYESSPYCHAHHNLVTRRTQRRIAESGQPRFCAFTLEDGERCDRELSDENSYPGAYYCKTHHYVMMQRARAERDTPRFCAFVEDGGERCGLELHDENSYKDSYYCREHHIVMSTRARERRQRPQ